jgi:hypothetical protein
MREVWADLPQRQAFQLRGPLAAPVEPAAAGEGGPRARSATSSSRGRHRAGAASATAHRSELGPRTETTGSRSSFFAVRPDRSKRRRRPGSRRGRMGAARAGTSARASVAPTRSLASFSPVLPPPACGRRRASRFSICKSWNPARPCYASARACFHQRAHAAAIRARHVFGMAAKISAGAKEMERQMAWPLFSAAQSGAAVVPGNAAAPSRSSEPARQEAERGKRVEAERPEPAGAAARAEGDSLDVLKELPTASVWRPRVARRWAELSSSSFQREPERERRRLRPRNGAATRVEKLSTAVDFDDKARGSAGGMPSRR